MSAGDPQSADEKGPFLRWIGVALIVVVLDQITKYLATGLLGVHQPVEVLPFLNLTLTHNTGAAFSFLSDAGGWQRWFFSGLSAAVAVVILIWLRSLPRGQTWTAVALALVLGGALGNLWDRLTHGAVIDFIDVHYRSWHWPAFNVADSAITVGAVLLLLGLLREGRKRAPARGRS